MNLASVNTTPGVAPYDEYGLKVVIDKVPGTPDTTGKAIFCTDITADYAPAEDWITHRSEGSKEDDYSAVLREWGGFSGNIAPDYKLLFWKALALYGLPVSQTGSVVNGVAVTDYEFRLPTYGSVERVIFTSMWGRPDNAFFLPYSIIQAMSLTNAATGNTEGSITIIGKKGTRNETMIGFGANAVQSVTVVDLAAPANIVIPNTALGAGGNVSITVNMTAAALRTALAAVPAIRNVRNVRVTGAVAGGDGEFFITFLNQLAFADIPLITTASPAMTIAEEEEGVSTPVVPYEPRPILPKHWWHRRGDTRIAALASDKIKGIETHSLEIADSANAHYTEDQSDTFTDHVDGPMSVRGDFSMAYSDDPDSLCNLIHENAHKYISIPQWHIMGADSPDPLYNARWGIYASVSDVAPFGNENNVYRQTFPFSRKRNTVANEGYSFFHILRLPTAYDIFA